MDINIRRTKTEDYENIENLIEQVQKLHSDLVPDVFIDINPVLDKDFFEKHMLSGKDYIAEYDGKVVGYVSMSFLNKEYFCMRPINVVRINTLIVDEKYRNKGIGTQLINFAKKLKNDRGFDKIKLTAWCANEDAISFYKHIGMKPQTITFEL